MLGPLVAERVRISSGTNALLRKKNAKKETGVLGGGREYQKKNILEETPDLKKPTHRRYLAREGRARDSLCCPRGDHSYH